VERDEEAANREVRGFFSGHIADSVVCLRRWHQVKATDSNGVRGSCDCAQDDR
jgi:hypothetical protein